MAGAQASASVDIQNALFRSSEGRIEILEFNRKSPPVIVLKEGTKLLACHSRSKKCLLPLTLDMKDPAAELTIEENHSRKKISVSILPSNFPHIRQKGNSALKLPLIFSVTSPSDWKNYPGCHLFVLSSSGEIDFYRNLPDQCIDFRPHDIEGKRFYSYSQLGEFINHVGNIGTRVILDENFHEIKRVNNTDHHEFHLLGSDHWISMEYRLGRLSGGKSFLDKRIVERKADKIIFDWGVSDYMKQSGSELALKATLTEFRNEVVAEIFHFNRIQLIGEKGFVLGLGNDGIAYLDKESKKIIWTLGGIYDDFNLSIGEQPLFNHAAQFFPDTGKLYLFSNHHFAKVGSVDARILSYDLDVERKKLLKFTVLRNKKEMSLLMGSLELTGDILSVGFGTKEVSSSDFIEMKENGDELWTIGFDRGWAVYRFYRSPWP